MSLTLSARNAQLDEVFQLLVKQADVKYDVVAPATHLNYEGGLLVVANGRTEWVDDTPFNTNAILRPTALFDEQIAEKLEIPIRYLRKMRETEGAIELLDRNVNHWMAEAGRNYLVRGFLTDDGDGIARAFLSDQFKVIDHVDAVMAALDGIRRAGVRVEPRGCDLTERRLRIHLRAPDVVQPARDFLRDYVAPSGERGITNPLVEAGVVLSNSETGGGAFTLAPEVLILVCRNGMTRMKEAVRKVHLGHRLDEGVVAWSEETRRANIELIRSEAADAVATFLTPEYLAGVVAELEHKGTVMLDNPQQVLEGVGKAFAFTKEEQESILNFFIRGGQPTTGGVVQAVTAFAQTVEDADRAAELEESAFDILDKAYALVA